jgi:uncharacterized protein
MLTNKETMETALLLQKEKQDFLDWMSIIEEDHNITILLAYARGSQMYGTATETSDVDISFVYKQPLDVILKTDYVPYIDLDGKGNVVGYEIQRYIELLTLNNPNILESLDIPDDCLIYKHESMDLFTQEDWVTKLTEKTILGYADSQIKKATGLNKNMNNPQPVERKSILDFCYIVKGTDSIPLMEWIGDYPDELKTAGLVKVPNGKGIYALYLDFDSEYNFRGLIKDNDSTQLRLSEIPKEFAEKNPSHVLWYNLDGFEVHCKQHKAYWDWVEKRNEERHKTNVAHGKNYDSKNMMHLFRLLEMAFIIATTGRIVTRTDDPEWLLEIREGKLNYDNLMRDAEWMFNAIKDHYKLSDLPETPDIELGKELLLKFRNNV